MRGYTQIFLAFFFVYCAPTFANICPDGWSGLLPDPEDCGKFYQCAHGVPHSFNCTGDLHFNPNLLVCDWPENAGCVVSTTTISTPAPSSSTTAPPPTTSAPLPSSPLPPSPTATPTSPSPPPPQESTTSSPVSTTTISTSAPPPSTTAPPPTTSAPLPSSPLPPSPTVPPTSPPPQESTTSSLPTTTSTPPPSTTPPSSPSPTTQPPTTEEEEELITEPPPTEPPQEDEEAETTPYPETTYPTTLPPEFEGSGDWESSGSGDDDFVVRCPARNPGADIFLPDPRDCNAFYYCNWGVAVPQHCPSGLHWSVRSSECATPSEADCNF